MTKPESIEIPSFWAYMQPTLEVLRERDGSATIQELVEHAASRMGLSAEQLSVVHDPERGTQSEIAYRMAWARSYLKKAGLIDNSEPGVWSLTEKGKGTERVDGRAIAREIRGGLAEREKDVSEADISETYLFAWNPKHFEWSELEDRIREVRETGAADDRWSCGNVKNIPPGSRFFLIRLRNEPRGIVGSGVTLDEVYQAPHWSKERAAEGETTNFVEVRFDALARVPLLRRNELEEPPFAGFKWDAQMSGIRIPKELADPLEKEWQRRVGRRARGESPVVLGEHVIERWREYWDEAKTDSSWVERERLLDAKRREVLPQIRDLISGFLEGEISLGDFRDTFDRKTRKEWDFFGFKGNSGAMFLNKLVKHLPDQKEVARILRRTLQAPASEANAREEMTALMEYLDEQIESGAATGAGLQPNRAPFFVSGCWHAQKPEEWPIFYQSARKALQADGFLGGKVKGTDGYLEFTRLFRTLAEGVGLSFWGLEHLCVRRESSDEIDEENDAGDEDETSQRERVWLISPGRNASLFDDFYEQGIIAIGWEFLGDLTRYDDLEAIREAFQKRSGGEKNPFQNTLACYQFAHEMKVGDIVFAKRGRKEIVGYGLITSEYRHEPERGRMTNVRSVDWKKRGEWIARDRPLVTKTLTEIGKYPGLVADIRKALGIEDVEEPEIEVEKPAPAYELDAALQELFLPRDDVEEALELLRYKKNLVLQGPPGVGKTFFAKRLAYLLLGEKDTERIDQVQFHQSYSYEDFIQGYRPLDDGKFARVDGPFLRFCDKALQDPGSPYVMVVDEINRGNLSKIFGELLLLIEADKRSEAWATTLTYSREGETPFYVPKNLHLIGTMNTADRSLAMVDYALRRRFAFFDVRPGFGLEGFLRRLASLGAEPALRDRIIARLLRLNQSISKDTNLGAGFCIGHSYFCQTGGGPADGRWYERIVRTEIAPLLREYWFDHTDRADEEVAGLLDDD